MPSSRATAAAARDPDNADGDVDQSEPEEPMAAVLNRALQPLVERLAALETHRRA